MLLLLPPQALQHPAAGGCFLTIRSHVADTAADGIKSRLCWFVSAIYIRKRRVLLFTPHDHKAFIPVNTDQTNNSPQLRAKNSSCCCRCCCRPFNIQQQVDAFLRYPAVQQVDYNPQQSPTRLAVTYKTPRRVSNKWRTEVGQG
jgi:hypothetical protein